MDYRKIIVYIIVILAALGYWYKTERDDRNRAARAERFSDVYSATSVLAELYRNEPERFFQARDSIFEVYNFNTDSINDFKQTFEGQEEEWSQLWLIVRHKTDSLIEYFRANPIDHPPPDSVDEDTTDLQGMKSPH